MSEDAQLLIQPEQQQIVPRRYPNFTICDEIIFTGPRWRNTARLSRAQEKLLDSSIFSVDSIKTLSAAHAARRSISLQFLLLISCSFILALESLIAHKIARTEFPLGTRIYIAATYPLLIGIVGAYAFSTQPSPPTAHESVSGRWIGIAENESAAAMPRASSSPATATISELMNPDTFTLFMPVALCWCLTDYLVFLSNRLLRPWPLRALTLFAIPTAAVLNVLAARRVHTRTQWLFLAAHTLLSVSLLSREFDALEAADLYGEEVIGGWRLAPFYVIFAAIGLNVLTVSLSVRHAVATKFRAPCRTSVQLLQALLCMAVPQISLAIIELIQAASAGQALLPLLSPSMLSFLVCHAAKTYFAWTLAQQFDAAYKAVTLGFSWVLIYAGASAAGECGNAFFEGSNCLCLTACLLGYAASKSDETKLGVLRFIEKELPS